MSKLLHRLVEAALVMVVPPRAVVKGAADVDHDGA